MTRDYGRYEISCGHLIHIPWRYVGAALLSAVLIEPAVAGTNNWTAPVSGTACGTTSNPVANFGGIAACHTWYIDAQVTATPTTVAKCSNAIITASDFSDTTAPIVYTATTVATYDNTAPLTCTDPKASTQAGWSFTQNCAAVGEQYSSDIGGCAPSAPSGLVIAPYSTTQFDLSWGASSGAAGYEVGRCEGASCTNFALIAAPASTSYQNTGLATATTYRYRVRAFNAAGNRGAYSTIAEATTSGSSIQYIYDELGRISLVTTGTGASIVYSYDESGNVSAIVRTAP